MKCLFTGLSDYNILKMFTIISTDPRYNKRLPNGQTNGELTVHATYAMIKMKQLIKSEIKLKVIFLDIGSL